MSIYVAPKVAQPAKAGPIGSGAGVLLTEFPLFSILGKDPHAKMRTAYAMGLSVPWIRRAEMLIGQKVASVKFELEDPEDVEIEASYPSPDAVAAWSLLQKPQALLGIGQPLSRSQLMRLSSRHIGLAGNAFWLQDQPEAFAGTPQAIAYLRPDRLTPNEDATGNLRSWQIDKTRQSAGIEVSLEQIVHFMLEPPDSGHFGPGLVETALLRGQNSVALDRHIASILSAGGRLSGIVSPKAGIADPDQMLQMERDWRTIAEQPDAAKRLQLIAAPVEFIPTTMTPDELEIVKLMELMRDDLLAVWNIPGSLIGVSHTVGLNGGETRKYDEAALWQGPVHDRLEIFREGISDSILAKFAKRIGWEPRLILEEPAFDDEAPRYDLLEKSRNAPLTNRERREIIGLEPFDDERDEEVWLPAIQTLAFIAPDDDGKVRVMKPEPKMIQSGEPSSDAAMHAAGETSMGKATLNPRIEPLRRSLLALRDQIATYHTPRVRDSVAAILAEQRRDIAQRIRAHAEQITQKPRGTQEWWDGKRWDRELTAALSGALTGMAISVSRQVADVLPPAKAGPVGAVERVLTRGAARVTAINEATRDEITAILADAVSQGIDLRDVATALEEGSDLTPLIGRSGGVVGDLSYRSEMIARTELMEAYNHAALGSYADAGLRMVQAIDGDKDEQCAARDGREYTITEAEGISDHPNGTLDWVPIL